MRIAGIIKSMSSLHIRAMGESSGSLWDLSANQIRDLAASLRPTPGGGAISLLSATLGLALVQKGASVSLKRAGEDQARHAALSNLCGKIPGALDSIGRLVDADAQAFQSYLKARSLPRGTEAEQTRRNAAMKECILQATRVPLASARAVCAALEDAATAVNLCDLHLLSDIFGGVLLMQAAVRAVLLNVDANLLMVPDPGTISALKLERRELEAESETRGEAIARAYQARLDAANDLRSTSAP